MLLDRCCSAVNVLGGLPAKINIRNDPLKGIACSRYTGFASTTLVTFAVTNRDPGARHLVGIKHDDFAG
jgi:hypothetical protein